MIKTKSKSTEKSKMLSPQKTISFTLVEIKKIRKALKEYCELDTMAMVDIVTELRKIVTK